MHVVAAPLWVIKIIRWKMINHNSFKYDPVPMAKNQNKESVFDAFSPFEQHIQLSSIIHQGLKIKT